MSAGTKWCSIYVVYGIVSVLVILDSSRTKMCDRSFLRARLVRASGSSALRHHLSWINRARKKTDRQKCRYATVSSVLVPTGWYLNSLSIPCPNFLNREYLIPLIRNNETITDFDHFSSIERTPEITCRDSRYSVLRYNGQAKIPCYISTFFSHIWMLLTMIEIMCSWLMS